MLLYYPFWMFMGFTLHFYIIFGTNLLTRGPAQITVFCLFQCFEEKEYQTESKWNETFGSDLFGTNAIRGTWRGRQATNEAATRVLGAPYGGGRTPHPRGPLVAQPTYFFLLYMFAYPRKHPGAPRNPISTAATFCIQEIPSWGLFRSSAEGGIDVYYTTLLL